MNTCAYCDSPTVLTREHVIPNWYARTEGESEVFNLKSPFSHTRGDIITKDVCADCNNKTLGKLDEYGKALYEKFFHAVTFFGDRVSFQYDFAALSRWLLKLSFNSGRVNNADVSTLSEFRKSILGLESLPTSFHCFLHLTAPTYFDKKGRAWPARHRTNHSELFMPNWFRIGPLRLPFAPNTEVMQRIVCINSFSFSLLATSGSSLSSASDLAQLSVVLRRTFRGSVELRRDCTTVDVVAAGEDAANSMSFLVDNFPSRFAGGDDSLNRLLFEDKFETVLLPIERELIDSRVTDEIVEVFMGMIATKESAMSVQQRIVLSVSGYDDDPRELWEISEVRDYLCEIFTRCPFLFFLASHRGQSIALLFNCWLAAKSEQQSFDERRKSFLELGFSSLNLLTYRLGFSVELNRAITEGVMNSLRG